MKHIDFHTHIFPDSLAASTIPALEKKGNVKAALNGTLAGLTASMDRAEIEKSVVCLIATNPSQFSSILSFSDKIRSDRIVPFPSFHPRDPECLARIEQIRAEGYKGIKLHPFYQEFTIDEQRLLPVYGKISELGLILVMHTGYDIGFPDARIADPARIVNIIERFPELKLITTHLGSWRLWDEVRERLIGRPVYMDISYSLDFLPHDEARALIMDHPEEYVLFGSDSPWEDQLEAIEKLRALNVGEERERKILRDNALRLLDSG